MSRVRKAGAKTGPRQSSPETVLQEAERVTRGDRQAAYGPPEQDFYRVAEMANALFATARGGNRKFEPRDVAMFMILVKLSRETHQRKRDNAVDIAGYAHCLAICQQAAELRGDDARHRHSPSTRKESPCPPNQAESEQKNRARRQRP